jgi:hypothetical protein
MPGQRFAGFRLPATHLSATRSQRGLPFTIAELMKKGTFGAGVFQTADCRKTYEELKAKGLEFLSPPKEQFYGIEAVFRDPFGNWFSMTQPKKSVERVSKTFISGHHFTGCKNQKPRQG